MCAWCQCSCDLGERVLSAVRIAVPGKEDSQPQLERKQHEQADPMSLSADDVAAFSWGPLYLKQMQLDSHVEYITLYPQSE